EIRKVLGQDRLDRFLDIGLLVEKRRDDGYAGTAHRRPLSPTFDPVIPFGSRVAHSGDKQACSVLPGTASADNRREQELMTGSTSRPSPSLSAVVREGRALHGARPA